MQEKQVFYYNSLNYFPESHMAIIGVEFKLKDITLIKIINYIYGILQDKKDIKQLLIISINILKEFVYDISSQINFDNLQNGCK